MDYWTRCFLCGACRVKGNLAVSPSQNFLFFSFALLPLMYCNVFGVCVTNNNGFLDLMIEFIGPLYNLVATVHKSLFDWTLASSDHTTPSTELTALHSLDYSDFVYIASGRTPRIHHFQQYPVGLPLRLLVMDGFLLLPTRMSRACLPSRYLVMGLCVTILSPLLYPPIPFIPSSFPVSPSSPPPFTLLFLVQRADPHNCAMRE
jgi:hypothetical protein